jgi:site-specific recombinase XerD
LYGREIRWLKMPSPKVTTLTIESIENFRLWLSARGKSEQTAKAYSTDLRMLLEAMGLVSIPQENYSDLVMAWLTKYREIVSYKTTVRRMTSAKCFAKWARWHEVQDELMEYDLPTPAKGMPHPLPEGMPGVRRMIDHGERESYKCLVALCGMAGTRIGEALSITANDFDLHSMSLAVKGKGDKERNVPINDECWSILAVPVTRARLAGTRDPLVGLRDRFARSTVTRLGVRAGISRPVSSHDLRATFATELYNRTLDQRLVQEILGHASQDQTSLYIGHTMRTLHEAVNKL